MITQPDALAKHNRKQILAAKLKAYHAERLMRKGWPDDAAARAGADTVMPRPCARPSANT